MDCARAIVQAGIKEVVISRERMRRYASEFYDEHFNNVEVLFQEAGVKITQLETES